MRPPRPFKPHSETQNIFLGLAATEAGLYMPKSSEIEILRARLRGTAIGVVKGKIQFTATQQ
jgi:hypothetical protein